MPTTTRSVTIVATVDYGSGLVHQMIKGTGESYVRAFAASIKGLSDVINGTLEPVDKAKEEADETDA